MVVLRQRRARVAYKVINGTTTTVVAQVFQTKRMMLINQHSWHLLLLLRSILSLSPRNPKQQPTSKKTPTTPFSLLSSLSVSDDDDDDDLLLLFFASRSDRFRIGFFTSSLRCLFCWTSFKTYHTQRADPSSPHTKKPKRICPKAAAHIHTSSKTANHS